jgi:hypothetical protein
VLIQHLLTERSTATSTPSLRGGESRRGNPELWRVAFSMRQRSSEKMELDCRVGCASSQ